MYHANDIVTNSRIRSIDDCLFVSWDNQLADFIRRDEFHLRLFNQDCTILLSTIARDSKSNDNLEIKDILPHCQYNIDYIW